MDKELSRLLGTCFKCECGRQHELPVREFVYEAGAIEALGPLIERCAGRVRRVAVVADTRTQAVCGAAVGDVLADAGYDVESILIADLHDKPPKCDDETFQTLHRAIGSRKPHLVVAVGSGVVNDLSKWVSFDLGLPYMVVATAASMNGYSAANVAPTVEGVKTLIEARPPLAVLARPTIIAAAPAQMTAAGFGDTIAKFFSRADWVTNTLLLDEYYCPFCACLIERFEHLFLTRPADIAEGKAEAIDGLFEALFWAGVAMTLVGTSAPASGGEHLLSHTLDMVADTRGWGHDLHGRQVGLGTLLAAALYDRLLAIESPTVTEPPRGIDRPWWANERIADAVAAQYQAKQPVYRLAAERIRDRRFWDSIRQRIGPIVIAPGRVRQWLTDVGGAVRAADVGRTPDEFRQAILHAHEMRKRFSIIDFAWLVGILPGAVDEIVEQWFA